MAGEPVVKPLDVGEFGIVATDSDERRDLLFDCHLGSIPTVAVWETDCLSGVML